MDPIVKTILNFIQHSAPVVRYAVYHAIGQISDDMKPDFSIHYKDVIIPLLLKGARDDCPRVVSHVFAAMTNYLEDMDPEHIQPYLTDLLKL